MGRAAKTLRSEAQLYEAGVRALMRRAHSVHDLRVYLTHRAEEAPMAERVIARLRAEGLLDDARYAREFARQRAENRRQGSYRIARELRAHGVADRHIEAALEECFAKADETALLRERLRRQLRKIGSRPGEALEQRRRASVYRSLLRAGFSAEDIGREMRRMTGGDPEEPPDSSAEEG